MLENMLRHISRQRDQIIDWQCAMTAIPAMGPENGGQGETEKAAYLETVLRGLGLSVERVNAPDARVANGLRPNLISRIEGRSPRTLWVLAHMDVVPPGDLSLWNTDPWSAHVEGDLVYGRGTEDNQQAIISGLLIAQALRELEITPDLSYGLMFVADEECGNTHGSLHLLAQRRDVFGEGDCVIAPDFGVNSGEQVCVAEKSMLWLKVTVTGVQCHASRPSLGRNALVAASRMIVRVQEELEQAYPAIDLMFQPESRSTFTPTRHDANVPNVNTVPGKDVFFIDCRILGQYAVTDVLVKARAILEDQARASGVSVVTEIVQAKQAAPSAPADSFLVTRLSRGIRKMYQCEPSLVGAGGGTVASDIRAAGLEGVAWARVTPSYHEPNEHSSIANTIGDAQVMATILFDTI